MRLPLSYWTALLFTAVRVTLLCGVILFQLSSGLCISVCVMVYRALCHRTPPFWPHQISPFNPLHSPRPLCCSSNHDEQISTSWPLSLKVSSASNFLPADIYMPYSPASLKTVLSCQCIRDGWSPYISTSSLTMTFHQSTYLYMMYCKFIFTCL